MLTLIIVASLLAFFFVVSNLVWFFFCKHKSEILEITDKSFTQSVRDSFDEKFKLSKEISYLKDKNVEMAMFIATHDIYEINKKNDILMVENDELRKKIDILQTKVECQESFVRGANMGYEALSACNPSLFKPDAPASTTVVVEEIEDKPENKLKIT